MERFQIIRGFIFPKVHWNTEDNIVGTLDYVPKDGDIITASYPKTGTTWLHYIVLQITSKGEFFPPFNDISSRTFMESAGPEGINSLKSLKIYKHHYRYDMVKKNPKSKVLYIYRNPEDTLVSYFHFKESVLQKKLNLEEFFDGFITGNIAYGSYFEHVLSFFNHKDDDNLLMISYEKLYAKPKEEILRIAKFLGEEYYQDISTDESLLNKIVRNTSFDNMKKNLKFERRSNNLNDNSEKSTNPLKLFRKGVVGDAKNLLSEKQIKQLREKSAETMKDTFILKEWAEE